MHYLIHRFEELPSTNDEARRLAEEGAAHGTVVVADVQTAGRGRLGRPWTSPPGGLWFSIIMRPEGGPSPVLSLHLAAAACRAIRVVTGREALVDWPNDIVLPPRYLKAGGVLLETRGTGWVVAGIGLDANVEVPPELHGIAESISTEDIRERLL